MNNLRLLAAALVVLSVCASVNAQEEDAPKVEAGALFTSLAHRQPDFFGTENLPGLGARFSYNLNDYVAVEAEVNLLPSKAFSSTAAGGRAHQAQFGVKAGKRFRRFGVFGKARPGFVSFRETLVFREGPLTLPGGQVIPDVVFFDYRRKTHLSLDAGGVLEIYPSRRVLVRFDVGDTMIRYPVRDNPSGAFFAPPPRLPAELRHNLQVTAGIGFRF